MDDRTLIERIALAEQAIRTIVKFLDDGVENTSAQTKLIRNLESEVVGLKAMVDVLKEEVAGLKNLRGP